MQKVAIHTEYIKLSQLLKLAGLVDQGSDTKIYLAEGKVKRNGEIITERGKKIYPNDIVEITSLGTIQVVEDTK